MPRETAAVPATAHNLLPRDGEMYFSPDAIASDEAARLYTRLRCEIAFARPVATVYGRQHTLPRGQAWFSDGPYKYAGMTLSPAPLPECLLPLKAIAERIAHGRFNGVLVNLYETGRDYVSWHSDDESKVIGSVIASLSLGGTRRFLVRRRDDRRVRLAVYLTAGSCLLMAGTMQQHWQHSVPKVSRAEPRINLTFRRVAVAG
jgi:alkylated DNA repair dioxygenase AlkB